MTFFRILISHICLALIAPMAGAIDFRVLNWSGDLSGVFFQGGDGKMQEIDAGKRRFSETYTYTGKGPLKLFSLSGLAGEGDENFLPVAEVSPVPSYQTLGLISFKSPDGNRYRLYQLDIGADTLPAGSFCFVNMTERQLAFQVGENTFYLDPSQNKAFLSEEAGKIDDESGGSSIVVRAAEQHSDIWKQILNVRWMLSSTARTFVIVYDNPNGKIAMRRFSDDG